ncbi:MAG: hypothetical protein ACRDDD_04070, partial [Plesiomonas sp.]|uniref:hypothetical protein n=1 Tax=Plesiomonas sp. TaxID=2486279 RepID=UPI003EE7A025
MAAEIQHLKMSWLKMPLLFRAGLSTALLFIMFSLITAITDYLSWLIIIELFSGIALHPTLAHCFF